MLTLNSPGRSRVVNRTERDLIWSPVLRMGGWGGVGGKTPQQDGFVLQKMLRRGVSSTEMERTQVHKTRGHLTGSALEGGGASVDAMR